ncbi:MAG: hypothetical protein EXR50_03920 [Dehalococcoidia bacterium]|nr:hypothetical protein [Dehalococcoidia bacterium]
MEEKLFAVQTTYIPIPGKGPELRALLEERMNASAAHGAQNGLVQSQLFGPDGTAFVGVQLFTDLAAYEGFVKKRNADPAYQAWVPKRTQVISAAPTQELVESIITPDPSTRSRDKLARVVTHVPILGKGPELRSVLEEHAKARQAQGFRASLWSQLFGPNGQAFGLRIGYPSLAAYEEDVAGRQSDPAYAEYLKKMYPLQSTAGRAKLFEVVARTS